METRWNHGAVNDFLKTYTALVLWVLILCVIERLLLGCGGRRLELDTLRRPGSRFWNRGFSSAGYSVALVARGAETVKNLAQELNSGGGEAAPFSVDTYSSEDISAVWKSIRNQYPAPKYTIDAAVYNIGQGVWKPFLDVTPEDIRLSLELNVEAAFAFSREAILTFKENKVSEDKGKRGTLIFTGATASLRGNTTTSVFAAGKFGLRALSQSLNKEFGKENIHVAHAIIDGVILSDRLSAARPEVADNANARLSPNSIAEPFSIGLQHVNLEVTKLGPPASITERIRIDDKLLRTSYEVETKLKAIIASMSSPARKVLVVIGLGTGKSTGAAVARRFSQDGYSVALIGRRPEVVAELADELNVAGGDASPFPAESYSSQDINTVWASIRTKYPAPKYVINTAVFNAGQSIWKPFLEVTPEDVRLSLGSNVEAAFAFAREVILTFKENEIEEPAGKRGTLIFTGATASIRGNVVTSVFSAGKHGLRALAQSLAKEFGKQNIHVR
ncbi:hypothetical protein H0H87_009725 [Tephrocybe sp. NHM501043]|nr:hypothetical protein H0H87_009725 [Tephrocybe sp. NHM501043]